MPPIRSTTHEETGLDRLLDIFKKPKCEAFVGARLKLVQDLETAVWEVNDYVSIEAGFGIILDNIGALVGRGRNDYSDDDYKVGLYVQIRLNRATGVEADLEDVTEIATSGGSENYVLTEHYPKTAIVERLEPDVAVEPMIDNLRQLRPLGTRMFLIYSPVAARANTFICGLSTDPTLGDGDQGCGISTDLDIGGRLSLAVDL